MQEYYTSGFLSLQSAIDAYTLGLPSSLEASLQTGPGESETLLSAPPQLWTIWGGVFPTAEYVHNDFYDAVGPMLGLLMSLSLVYPLSMLVRGIVEEREKRLKETMCIMGLQGLPFHHTQFLALVIKIVSRQCMLGAGYYAVALASKTAPVVLLRHLILYFPALMQHAAATQSARFEAP